MKFNPTIMKNKFTRSLVLLFAFFVHFSSFGQVDYYEQGYYSGLSSEDITRYYDEIDQQGIITDINEVPNVKVLEDKNVCDPHSILAAFAEEKIQVITDSLKAEKDYEIMVVCLNSIGTN